MTVIVTTESRLVTMRVVVLKTVTSMTMMKVVKALLALQGSDDGDSNDGVESGNDEDDDKTDEFETTPTSELARHVGDDGEQILENENIFREKSK